MSETTCTPFQSEPDAAPVRLIVRRVRPTPGSQLALFATYSYHGFITDRDGEMLELEADLAATPRSRMRFKYGVGLNHLPSGRFAANGAWLAVQVMAHNLARWTARIGLGQQIVTTKTQTTGLRPGRTNHPLGTPIDPASATALALGNPVQPRPGPTASDSTSCLTARLQLTQRPANRTSPQTRASPVCERLLLRPLPAISPCPTSPDGHKASPQRLKTDMPHLPEIVPAPSPSLAPIAHSAAVTSYLRWIRVK